MVNRLRPVQRRILEQKRQKNRLENPYNYHCGTHLFFRNVVPIQRYRYQTSPDRISIYRRSTFLDGSNARIGRRIFKNHQHLSHPNLRNQKNHFHQFINQDNSFINAWFRRDESRNFIWIFYVHRNIIRNWWRRFLFIYAFNLFIFSKKRSRNRTRNSSRSWKFRRKFSTASFTFDYESNFIFIFRRGTNHR